MPDKKRGPLATITAPITTTFKASFSFIQSISVNIGSLFGKNLLTGLLAATTLSLGTVVAVDVAGASIADEREPFIAEVQPDGTVQVGGTVFATILNNQVAVLAQLAQVQAQIAALIPPGPPGHLTELQAAQLQAIYNAIYPGE